MGCGKSITLCDIDVFKLVHFLVQHTHDSFATLLFYLLQYVDENYTGGGIGEFAIMDYQTGEYDYTACNSHGNGNCKLMDCHDPDTENWKLLGVFKEASYFGNDAFFEQLFKHEGVCVWNDNDLYDFMSETRENSFSSGCLDTGIMDSELGELYIDLKPTYNGNMTYSLYTDYVCSQEYAGYDYNVETVAANMGLLYGAYLEAWNDAMEAFKVCQPCRAYNLQVSGSSSYGSYSYNDGDGNNRKRDLKERKEGQESKTDEKRKLEWYNWRSNDDGTDDAAATDAAATDDAQSYYQNNYYNQHDGAYGAEDGWYEDDYYDPNYGYFRCDDDADYSNVNQCMKFRSHADLEPASWEDLVAATNQGGILQVTVNGVTFGAPFVSKEQEEYLTYERVQKQAAFEKELNKKKKQALAHAPTARFAIIIGQLWVVVGAVAFGFSANRLYKALKEQKSIKNQTLKEPLSPTAEGVVS